jgi:hypothetical protein
MADKVFIDGKRLLEIVQRHKDHSFQTLKQCRHDLTQALTKESAEELRRWTFQFSGECTTCDRIMSVIKQMIDEVK